MDLLLVARVVHVLSIVIWIGGVGFVTAVVLPAVRSADSAVNKAQLFEQLEGRFAWIARTAVLFAGASGFYMVSEYDLWWRFERLSYWWMSAMLALWTLFAVLLFVAEPLFLHEWFRRRIESQPEKTLASIQRGHNLLFLAGLITIAGAVAGSHGA